MKVSHVWFLATPWTIQSTEFFRPEYWSGSPFPSPGALPNQGTEPRSPYCRQILYQLSHEGSPRILEWVASPFSSGSSRLRNRTRVSCITGGFFTTWKIREAHSLLRLCLILNSKPQQAVTYFSLGISHVYMRYTCEINFFLFFSCSSVFYYRGLS